MRYRLLRIAAITAAAFLLVLLFARDLSDDTSPTGPSDPWDGPVLRVAAVQFDARPEDTRHNLLAMDRLARAAVAEGARVVLFHESSLLDYTRRVPELSQLVPDGPACRRMLVLARELDAWLGFGLSERDGDRFYIAHVFVGPAGQVQRYRKTWLFNARDDVLRDEWARYDPGDGPELFEIDGVRATILICADADSRRCVRRVRALRPQVVFFPNNRSNLPEPEDLAHLARDWEAPVVVSNRTGRSWDHDCIGGSMILSPDGLPLARANRAGREEIIVADVPILPR